LQTPETSGESWTGISLLDTQISLASDTGTESGYGTSTSSGDSTNSGEVITTGSGTNTEIWTGTGSEVSLVTDTTTNTGTTDNNETNSGSFVPTETGTGSEVSGSGWMVDASGISTSSGTSTTTSSGGTTEGTTTPESSTQTTQTTQNLTTLTLPERLIATYTYDPLGRRTAKTVNTYNETQEGAPLLSTSIISYTYAGDEIVSHTLTETNTLSEILTSNTTHTLFDPSSPDTIIAEIVNGQTHYLHQDHLGSTLAVSSSTGALLASYRYDPFGTPFVLSGSLYVPLDTRIGVNSQTNTQLNTQTNTQSTTSQTTTQPTPPLTTRLFTWREYDSETTLYHYRARTYNPHTGRFLQRDPVDTDDQINLYTYVGNNPINRNDPSGKFAVLWAAVSVGIWAGMAYYENGWEWVQNYATSRDIFIDAAAWAIWAGLFSKLSKVGKIGKLAIFAGNGALW
jgi:RHS repeat-associated protein